MASTREATDEDRRSITEVVLGGIASSRPLDDMRRDFNRYVDLEFPALAEILADLGADALGLAGGTRAEIAEGRAAQD